jgi:hypothetical protein
MPLVDRHCHGSSGLPQGLRDLVGSTPLVHRTTINANGSPQASVIPRHGSLGMNRGSLPPAS